jgi:cytochrome c553
LFNELLSLRECLPHPNLWLHVLLCEIEEVWMNDGNGSWRKRYWSLTDQRLLNVQDEIVLHSGDDFLGLLPPGLPQPFTNAELAKQAKCRARSGGQSHLCAVCHGFAGAGQGQRTRPSLCNHARDRTRSHQL